MRKHLHLFAAIVAVVTIASCDKNPNKPNRFDYIEHGTNHGAGIAVLGDWDNNRSTPATTLYWAPVNCGYRAVGTVNTDGDYRIGKFYQWGAGDPTLPYKYNNEPIVAVELYYTELPSPWYEADVIKGTLSDKWNGNQGPCPNGWRLPTAHEFKVLCDGKNSEFGWVEAGTYAGQTNTYAGAEFFGENSDKTPGKGVFFPAAGVRSSFGGNPANRTVFGNYWSSTTDPDFANYARFMTFGDSSLGPEFSCVRANGQSVRCVTE